MLEMKEIKKELREKLENDKQEKRHFLDKKELARVQKMMLTQVIKYHSYTYWEDLKENTKEFIEYLENNTKDLNKDIEAMYNVIFQDLKQEHDKFIDIKGKNRIPELKKIFNAWKEKIDKILKENNVELYAEHEFYDHLVALNDWVNEGNKFEDMFGDKEKFWNSDNLIITYDIVNEIIEAMQDCYYIIDDDMMFIDHNGSWYFGDEKPQKIDLTK